MKKNGVKVKMKSPEKCKNLVKYLLHIFVVLLTLIFIGGIALTIYFIFRKPVDYYAILIILGLMVIDALVMAFFIPWIIRINNGNEEDYFKEKAKEVTDAYIKKYNSNASQENNEVTKK